MPVNAGASVTVSSSNKHKGDVVVGTTLSPSGSSAERLSASMIVWGFDALLLLLLDVSMIMTR
jgi:hypothetical protein